MKVIECTITLKRAFNTKLLEKRLSIAHGIVPDQMTIARVIPLFKADDQSLFTNYRPVSVLPSFSKFLERIIITV